MSKMATRPNSEDVVRAEAVADAAAVADAVVLRRTARLRVVLVEVDVLAVFICVDVFAAAVFIVFACSVIPPLYGQNRYR